MCVDFVSCTLKKLLDALVRHILCPVFLFFAHGGYDWQGITNRCGRSRACFISTLSGKDFALNLNIIKLIL
jgi:hypothetical protein